MSAIYRFERLTRGDLPLLTRWFEDPETAKRMAGTLPLDRFVDYVTKEPNRFVCIIHSQSGPVASVDVELHGEIAYISLIVAPERRRQGVGRRVLQATLGRAELGAVNRVEADIDEDHVASRRCFTAAGFAPETGAADEDGFVKHVWRRPGV